MIMALTSLTFISACNATTEKFDDINTNQSDDINTVQTLIKSDTTVENKQKELSKKIPTNLQKLPIKNTVVLNGIKFKLLGKELKGGTRVLNLNMNEYGKIKGSFVIVLNKNVKIDKSKFGKAEMIAASTFRIWPLKTIDFVTFYNELLDNSNYSTVEVDIDYTPISKKATF